MPHVQRGGGAMIELRKGDWREVLADVGECDAVITDGPYSGRTHAGHGSMGRWGTTVPKSYDGCERSEINYSEMTPDGIAEFSERWCEACRGWVVSLTDDVLFNVWRDQMARHNRTVFQDVGCVITGMTVRQSGDGPSSWLIHAAVSRPPELSTWGTLPGAYVGPRERQLMTGAKPLWLMRAIIRDYTKPGDLICDPYAGSGTTLIAARAEGRDCIGAEISEETYEKAMRRIETPYTEEMWA